MHTSTARRSTVSLAAQLCTRPALRQPRLCYVQQWLTARGLTTQEPVPLRKHLKDEIKRKKAESKSRDGFMQTQHVEDIWELTVGIEVHAQLNTASKLFSEARTEGSAAPNQHVHVFDAAQPGAQPSFQVATLLPAIRAALVLGCTIQSESSWDRKHYFHWDQPNGYQITQYYKPFAKDGTIRLTAEDGVPAADLQGSPSLAIGIKQVQMEQDTAKTTLHSSSVYHVDLNRAGHALIEIITLPQIHSPQTAAAVVRKIQTLLKGVNACVSGMELGGLRADVNVSIRERGTSGTQSYSGVEGLGQRTEIKNLSSFKAVEDAIIAERDRQIAVLAVGGMIEGETRGWTLGSKETVRLRGKEGEVDYRYIPEADMPPLLIGDDLIDHLRNSMPELPDETLSRVQNTYGMTLKDAKTIFALDDGDRLEFMEGVTDSLSRRLGQEDVHKLGRLVGNWVLHELGGALSIRDMTWQQSTVTVDELADVLYLLSTKQITARSAKQLLTLAVEHESRSRPTIDQLVQDGNLLLRPLSQAEYTMLATSVMDANSEAVIAIREKGQRGKIMFLVGQMVRQAEEGTVEPERARQILEQIINT